MRVNTYIYGIYALYCHTVIYSATTPTILTHTYIRIYYIFVYAKRHNRHHGSIRVTSKIEIKWLQEQQQCQQTTQCAYYDTYVCVCLGIYV